MTGDPTFTSIANGVSSAGDYHQRFFKEDPGRVDSRDLGKGGQFHP